MQIVIEDVGERFKERVEWDALSPRGLSHPVCQRFDFIGVTLQAQHAFDAFKWPSCTATGRLPGPSNLIGNFVFLHGGPDDAYEIETDRRVSVEARNATEVGRLDREPALSSPVT